jgi:AcrR family transcriptional regulator
LTKRSKPEPRLSRERILEAAIEVVAGEGIEALSMRRLAQQLDVWPMSVYRYFQDKDALLDAIAATAVADIELPDLSASWRARMHALLEEARTALALPSAAGERLPHAFLTPEGLRVPEAGLAILRDAGLDDSAAVSAWRALWSYTFGFAAFALGPSQSEVLRRTRTAVAALPDEGYPVMSGAGPAFASALADEQEFERGLDLLLDGIEARA